MYLRYAPTLGFIQSAVHDPTVKISCFSFSCQHAPHLPLVELYIPIDIRNVDSAGHSKKERHESGDLIHELKIARIRFYETHLVERNPANPWILETRASLRQQDFYPKG